MQGLGLGWQGDAFMALALSLIAPALHWQPGSSRHALHVFWCRGRLSARISALQPAHLRLASRLFDLCSSSSQHRDKLHMMSSQLAFKPRSA